MGAFTKPLPGVTINPAHPLARGLIGCWLLGEGGGQRANDSSVGNNPGVLTNISSSLWPGSHHGGRALSFGGTNQCVSVQSSALLQSPTTALAVSAWCFVPTSAGNQPDFACIAEKDFVSDPRASPFTSYGLIASNGNNQHYCFITRTSAGSNDIQDSGIAITKGVWVFVCGVMLGATKRVYVNGVLAATNSNGVAMAYNNGRFTIGCDSASQEAFQGYIEGVRVYSRALSAAEVAWLYAEPYAGFSQNRANVFSVVSGVAVNVAIGTLTFAGAAAAQAGKSASVVAGILLLAGAALGARAGKSVAVAVGALLLAGATITAIFATATVSVVVGVLLLAGATIGARAGKSAAVSVGVLRLVSTGIGATRSGLRLIRNAFAKLWLGLGL